MSSTVRGAIMAAFTNVDVRAILLSVGHTEEVMNAALELAYPTDAEYEARGAAVAQPFRDALARDADLDSRLQAAHRALDSANESYGQERERWQAERDTLHRQLRDTDDTLDLARRVSIERGLQADSLRQQLEAAQREKAEATTDIITADRTLAAAQQRIAELEADLKAAPLPGVALDLRLADKRIAELEAEVTLLGGCQREYASAAQLLNSRRVPLQVDGRQIAMIDRVAWLISSHAKRIAELEALCTRQSEDIQRIAKSNGEVIEQLDTLTATLRAIAPVYGSAREFITNENWLTRKRLKSDVDAARSALTPDLQAVIERVCKEGQ